jgi:thiopurine S-methyltransferase
MNDHSNNWSSRYREGRTRWDLGEPSPPLSDYFDQLKDKNIKILIPGAGNAYEAEYLHKLGFNNVYVLDWAKEPFENLKKRYPDFPEEYLLNENFFEHKGEYDMVVEYVFFCAIPPVMRKEYAKKVHELLKPAGKFVAVLFDDPLEGIDGPPFGGSKEEYEKYFSPYFEFKKFETAYNSVKPREGRELFCNFVKK